MPWHREVRCASRSDIPTTEAVCYGICGIADHLRTAHPVVSLSKHNGTRLRIQGLAMEIALRQSNVRHSTSLRGRRLYVAANMTETCHLSRCVHAKGSYRPAWIIKTESHRRYA